MTTHPRSVQDLALAPVALEVNGNLRRIRDKTPTEIAYELVLELDCSADVVERAERADLVLAAATRNVNLHGWNAVVTDDGARIRLEGGSAILDVGLSASILDYIVHGATAHGSERALNRLASPPVLEPAVEQRESLKTQGDKLQKLVNN